jgi:hypothetical protein
MYKMQIRKWEVYSFTHGLDYQLMIGYPDGNQLFQESIMPRLMRRLVVLFALVAIAVAAGCSHTAPQAALSANG